MLGAFGKTLGSTASQKLAWQQIPKSARMLPRFLMAQLGPSARCWGQAGAMLGPFGKTLGSAASRKWAWQQIPKSARMLPRFLSAQLGPPARCWGQAGAMWIPLGRTMKGAPISLSRKREPASADAYKLEVSLDRFPSFSWHHIQEPHPFSYAEEGFDND